MFKIKALASGSKGNCYIISDGSTNLLLDAGVKLKEILVACGFDLDGISGALITHEHSDHALAAYDLAKRGVKVFGTASMADRLGGAMDDEWGCSGNIHCIRMYVRYSIGTMDFFAIPMEHDVPCYAYCVKSYRTGDVLLYATDTRQIPQYVGQVGQLIAEANYNIDLLKSSDKPPALIKRIAETHMSVETLAKYLERMDRELLKEVYLAHLSDDHSDMPAMAEQICRAAGDGVKVFICNRRGGVTDVTGTGSGENGK